MKIVFLDRKTLGDDVDLTPISSLGDTVCYDSTSPAQVTERIADADVVVINKIRLNDSNLPFAEKLKLICIAATGCDNVDTECCKRLGIAFCNVPGYSTDSVAQVSVAMAISLVTHLTEYRNYVHGGDYTSSGVANRLVPVYHEISGMKWGVVGGGGIGMRVADIAKALGADVSVCRRKNEGGYRLCDIDTLCRESDIISIHVPLSDSTRGMISKERIASTKDGVVIVNTARGAVCDEKALADFVKSGKIGGLGIDVYSVEPFDNAHPFCDILGYDNVILTPHMAWGSYESRTRCVCAIAKNITDFFDGKKTNRIV